jgi:trans-aconitate methyltransferase
MKRDNWDGFEYKENSAPQELAALKVLSNIKLNGDENILDMGCGDGKITLKISKMLKNGNVLGVDSSQSMIKEAKKFKSKNLDFDVLDINDLNFENKFDIIISFATLHWIEDHPSMLKKVHAALKKNGKIYFTVLRELPLPEMKDLFSKEKWIKHFKNKKLNIFPQKKESYLKFLEKLNFKNIHVIKENFYYTCKNFSECLNYIAPWIPQLTDFSKNIALDFSKDLATHLYTCNNKKIDMPLEISAKAIIVHAEKF